MELHVDEETCTGHGRCYALVPEMFEPDDAGHSVVKLVNVPAELEGRARVAVDNCPERAITLR